MRRQAAGRRGWSGSTDRARCWRWREPRRLRRTSPADDRKGGVSGPCRRRRVAVRRRSTRCSAPRPCTGFTIIRRSSAAWPPRSRPADGSWRSAAARGTCSACSSIPRCCWRCRPTASTSTAGAIRGISRTRRDRGTARRRRAAASGGLAGRGAGGSRDRGEVRRLRVVRLHPPPSRAPAAAAPRSLHAGPDRRSPPRMRSPTRWTTGASTSTRGRRAVIAHYEERSAAHAGRAAAEGACPRASRGCGCRRSFLASRCSPTRFGARTFPAAVFAGGFALLLVFAVLVVWHARVEQRVDWHDALRTGEPVRAGANRPGLGSTAAGRRSAPRNRASSIRAGSRSVRPGLAAAVARSGGHRRRAPIRCSTGCCTGAAGRDRRAAGGGGRTGAGARMARALRRARAAGRRSPPRRARGLSALGREPGPVHAQRCGGCGWRSVLMTAAIWLLIVLHAAGTSGGAWWLVPIVARHDPVVRHRRCGPPRVQSRHRRRSGLRAVCGVVRHVMRCAAELAASRGHPIAAGRPRHVMRRPACAA